MIADDNFEALLNFVDIRLFDYKYRYSTFIGKWEYDKQRDAKCTSKKLAKAGFICTATELEPDSARCFICQHELLWDPEDDPALEHAKHRPDCEFVKINKLVEDFSVKDWCRLLAYAYSVKMYRNVAETITTFEAAVSRLVTNVEKVL